MPLRQPSLAPHAVPPLAPAQSALAPQWLLSVNGSTHSAPPPITHSSCVEVQPHVPLVQISVAAHAWIGSLTAQPPQLPLSVAGSTQTPAQLTRPLSQPSTQAPNEHTRPSPHCMPQTPQLSRSF